MSLNDPFGRMARRHQLGYETMRESLRRGGITTIDGARGIIRQAKLRGSIGIAIGLLATLIVWVLLRQFFPFVAVLWLLLTVWVIGSTVNGIRYIERYIREDLR